MKLAKRLLPLMMAVLLLASLLAACGGGNSGSGVANSEGTNTATSEPSGSTAEPDAKGSKTLTVLVEGGSPANTVVEATKDAFKEQTGVEIIVDAVPYAGIYDKVMAEISSGTARHDLICIDALWLSAMKPGLASLNDVVTDEVKNDSMPGLLEGATIDGDLLGYPLWTNTQLLIYRTDMFEDADNMAAFEAEYGYPLAPPTTWEQFADVAKFFTKDDMYGTALHGYGPCAPTMFLNFASQAGARPLVLNDDMSAANINDQAYVDALRDFAAENNTVYWDFSLYKDVDTLNLLVGDFSDAHHLNGQGAEKFTAVLCDTIARENAGEDVSTLFYDTVEEKLELTPDQSIAMAHL